MAKATYYLPIYASSLQRKFTAGQRILVALGNQIPGEMVGLISGFLCSTFMNAKVTKN